MTEEERVAFRAGNGGQLNPDWTEWLMLWPFGWTGLKPMDKQDVEEWKARVINGNWVNPDPAELEKDDLEYCSRLTLDNTHRADRLKAIGNGQVPLCVFAISNLLLGLLDDFKSIRR